MNNVDLSVSVSMQEEMDRIRDTLEPEMLKRGIRLVHHDEIPNVNDADANIGINDRIAAFVSGVAGNILFAYALLTIAGTWMAYNVYLESVGLDPRDTPWEFPVMLLVSNFIQLMLPIFIMVSQKRLERRDRIRADRDHLVALMGKRDVLVMFSYFDEFSKNQQSMLQQFRTSQQKMLAMEQSQRQFMEVLTPKLMELVVGLHSALSQRPCIIRDLDRSLLEQVLEVLSNGGSDDGPEDDAQGPAGGQGREPLVGVEHADQAAVGQPGEGGGDPAPPGDDRV